MALAQNRVPNRVGVKTESAWIVGNWIGSNG